MISVIIPAKDASLTIGQCVQALLYQENMLFGHDYEVIVVDDGSSDDTACIAEQFGVKVVRQKNAGPAAARNTGVRLAGGDRLAFTDADCFPSPSWLRNLTQPFENPDVVGVKGTYRSSQTEIIPRFVQLEYEYKYARMRKQAAIDFIDTNSAAYRKDVFYQNGGFDETFTIPSVEDQEFSFRLARKGYRMVFAPDAVVFHRHDRTLREYLIRKLGIGYWKAVMLRWIPEKTFTDSHTAPTQRLEIFLIGMMVITIPFILIWLPYSLLVFLFFLLSFFIITASFLKFIGKRDPGVLWIGPGMLFFRALALGFGLINGFFLPPKLKVTEFPCQKMGIRLIKRVFDILGASIGLLLSFPVITLAAVAIKLDSSGPVFYQQLRAGENGKPFMMIKLRTMVEGADRMVLELLNDHQQGNLAFKIPNDPRVTRVGRFLRRWSLDEIPQFWNVLVGDMSLVGPRPEELHIVEKYTDYQRQRLMVKPGLTGPMQVSGRGGLDFERRLQLELDYLKNYKLLDDIKIIIRTFSAIISGEGAS